MPKPAAKNAKETPGTRVSSDEPLLMQEGEANYHQVKCPSCAAPDATLRMVSLDIPYFGEVFETIFLCAQCGFKHIDALIPAARAPTEYSLRVEGERDLFVRAVKSSSTTVAVPELGLLWEPGPASLAEVTNVEGLLRRFEDAVKRAKALFDSPETNAKGDQILRALTKVIDGKRTVTMVLKDPYGNGALIDPRGRAKSRPLTPKETAELATGEYVIELGESGAAVKRRDGPGAH